MKRKKTRYHCSCWLCMSAKEKKAIAREKEKRLFRCGGRTPGKIVLSVNTMQTDGV